MSTALPRLPLVLGLLGTLPFIAGAVMTVAPGLVADLLGAPLFTARLMGAGILHAYGTVILAFMSGALWGFATKAPEAQSGRFYIASVLPAILVFFNAVYVFAAPLVGWGQPTLVPLLIGFIALLGLDYMFWRADLAPKWWMKLRMVITVIVTLCLIMGVTAG